MKNLLSRLEAAEARLRNEISEDERGRNFVTRVTDKGFTLIELLVVITILGILAAIVVFSVAGIGDKGQTSACKTDTVTIRTAQEANFAQKGAYAADIATLITNGFLSSPSTLHATAISGATYTISTAAGVTACGGTGGQVVDGTTIL